MLTQFQSDLKTAMLAKDDLRKGVLRMAITALNNEAIAKGAGTQLTKSDCEVVVKRMIKSRMDSAEQFLKGGAEDRAAAEKAEIAVLEAYLPKQLSEEQINEAIRSVIAELSAVSKKDMGRVMKRMSEIHGNSFDGKVASQKVQALLS